jgi:hypothetical protein
LNLYIRLKDELGLIMDSIEKEDDPDKKQILINNAKDF